MPTGKDQETDVSSEGTDEYLIEALTDEWYHLNEQAGFLRKRRRELRQWRQRLLVQRAPELQKPRTGGLW